MCFRSKLYMFHTLLPKKQEKKLGLEKSEFLREYLLDKIWGTSLQEKSAPSWKLNFLK